MQFGLFGGALAPRGLRAEESARGYHDFVQLNVEAEALGYRSSFVTEHHFTGIGQVSATLTLLAWIASRTERLRLGTAVLVLPWHNPVLLAEQVATVDLLSGGRLDLGVGKGYRHTEFAGFAIPPDEAELRFDECFEVMVRALSSDKPLSHRGRFWRFDDIAVEPAPTQRPHPPIWLAAGRPESVSDCARRGCNMLLNQFASPEAVGDSIALYRRELDVAGRAFGPMMVGVARNMWVADTRAEAAAAVERQARAHARIGALSVGSQSRSAHILAYTSEHGGREAHALIGVAEEIIDKLCALREQGVAYVLLNGLSDRENFRRFAERVMPALA
ncbi:MAG TPA: LLM class flavin-dependent oxidoreductase [Caulobacteraceae bacterium]|nr:LLM class flavin-dependent oxidoreductase [Caulobacteraceae bacterium]